MSHAVPPPPASRPTTPEPQRWARVSSAWWITGVYAVFAALWIYFSDRILAALVPDPEAMVRLSVYKGLAFVAVTSALLLMLTRRAFSALESERAALRVEHREARAHQAEVARLSRLSSALSYVNQAIARAPARESLFQRVCEILVDEGGFPAAWIGLHDPATARIVPMAARGEEPDRVHDLEIYVDDRERGHGPSGIAFRSGRPYVSNDALTDPATEAWRDQLQAAGFRSAATFPISLDGVVIGLLNVYAGQRDFFQDREVSLLSEVAEDVSLALGASTRERERKEAQEVARNERRLSEAMLESMPGIVYIYTVEGRFLRWNRNFETASGYSEKEIATMHPLDFFHPEDREELEARIAEVFEVGESFVEAPFRSRDGGRTPYFFTGRRITFAGQECLVGVGIDVSERARAEAARRETEARFRNTLDNVLEGCQIIGFDWRYLYLNHAAERQNRRPNEELLGRTVQEVWPGITDGPVFALLRSCLEERVALHQEAEFVFPDGTSGWFDLRCQPVPEGVFLLSIDISERRQAEDALRQLNETLEQKVVERTAELKTALTRAEAADRLKSAFLATMSHELRTPLNSILGFTGIVLQGLAGPLTDEQTRQLGMVRGSARHLLDLITDVLDLSKIEAGQLEVRAEAFDLRATIDQVVDTLRPMADAQGLFLSVDVAPSIGTVVSDRRRVQQVLLNLLNNAIKFTDEGAVTLAATVDHDRVVLAVRDTGIGIREEDMEHLFAPFRQVDAGLTRHREGTGLGLAICRRLATLMGGGITATSRWGEGSEFRLTLPLHPTG